VSNFNRRSTGRKEREAQELGEYMAAANPSCRNRAFKGGRRVDTMIKKLKSATLHVTFESVQVRLLPFPFPGTRLSPRSLCV
jgi:hypothetical protein